MNSNKTNSNNNELLSKVNSEVINDLNNQNKPTSFQSKTLTPTDDNKNTTNNAAYEAKRDKIFAKTNLATPSDENKLGNTINSADIEKTRLENLKTKRKFIMFILNLEMVDALKKSKEKKKEVIYSEKIHNLKSLLENHILRKFLYVTLF